MAVVTSLLVWLAEFSHILTLSAIILVSLVMALFILRLIRQDLLEGGAGGVTHVTQLPPSQVSVAPVRLPFHLELLNPSQMTFRSFRVTLKPDPDSYEASSYSCRLYAGVSVGAFHHVLRAPAPWFRRAFAEGHLFGLDGCLEMGPLKSVRIEPDQDTVEEFTRDSDGLSLGSSSPRDKYPFVLVTLSEESENGEKPGSQVLATLHVIHVRDSVCQFPTQILSTNIKQFNGQVTHLQPIFISDDFHTEEQEAKTEKEDSLCVVCQELPITRVMLPCKHACVCPRCFEKLGARCPMCRSKIQSFFLIRTEDDVSWDSDEVASQRPQTWREWLRENLTIQVLR